MTTANPFDLLGDFDIEDPSQLIAKAPAPVKKALAPTQTNSKPLPPAQSAREGKKDLAGGRGGRGYGRGRGGFGNRDSYDRNSENRGALNGVSGGFESPEDGGMGGPSLDRPRGGPAPFRGGRRGGFSNGELSEGERPPRRIFDRQSGTGRRNDIKRDGAGRGNWGVVADQTPVKESEELVNQTEKSSEKNFSDDKLPGNEDGEALSKENPPAGQEEKESEDKEMTLEEYEKVLEEKRKALQALRRTEERKVDLDNDLKSMLLLSSKKDNDDVFIKLGSEKDLAKRKDLSDKEEKAKKSLSINEFLKPAEGERQSGPGGRGRGRGNRGGFRGGFGAGAMNNSTVAAPSIKDHGQFPTLCAK